ncbi:MAG: hypothetical protein ACI9ES_001481, partial [Oceanospirillaceae bacterium]
SKAFFTSIGKEPSHICRDSVTKTACSTAK